MRIFLLRILIGWWMILITWPAMVAIGWLLFGDAKPHIQVANEFAHTLWYGDLL